MKNTLKGFIAGLLAAAVFTSAAAFADTITKTLEAAFVGVKIVVNDEEITPSDANGNTVEPFIVDGTTYLPVRAVAEALGQAVEWDNVTKTVFIGEHSKTDGVVFGTAGGEDVLYDTVKYMAANYYGYFATGAPLSEAVDADGKPIITLYGDAVLSTVKELYYQSQLARSLGLDKADDYDFEGYYTATVGDRDRLNATLSSLGVGEGAFRSLVERDYLSQRLFDYMCEHTPSLADISDDDIKAYVNTQYVSAKHILVKDEAEAKEIVAALDGGAIFEDLIFEKNTDPGQIPDSKYTFTFGQMVEEFETAAFALEIGEYTKEPVKTAYGYHIIKRYGIDDDYIDYLMPGAKEDLQYQEYRRIIAAACSSYDFTYDADMLTEMLLSMEQ